VVIPAIVGLGYDVAGMQPVGKRDFLCSAVSGAIVFKRSVVGLPYGESKLGGLFEPP
jgi:hypothetical protein